jgi:hypothetical protein
MNRSQAVRLRTTLTKVYPDAAEITVVAEEDGAQVSIKADGWNHRYSIGEGESTLLRVLITGSPLTALRRR